MSDPTVLLPPPAPPLPPTRAAAARHAVLQRLGLPLGFGIGGSRPTTAHGDVDVRPSPIRIHNYAPQPSQTATHRTGIPIAALDISPDKSHAILAGKEILKTVRITEDKVTEEFNLRSAINAFAPAHSSTSTESRSVKRTDFLPASDVKWSHGAFDNIIATAANHGRIALYDLRRPEVEHAWLREHTRSVHKLAFNPHQGFLLLSGSHDGTVKAWDLRSLAGERSAMTMKSFRQYQGRADAVRDVRWSPTDGYEFVMGTDGGSIQAWDMRNGNAPKLRITGHEKACSAVDFHPDGRHVISAGHDRYIKVYDFQRDDRRQKPCFQLRVPQTVMNIRWRPACWTSEIQATGNWQSTQFATSYSHEDPRTHIWDLRRQHIPFRELDRYNSPATDLLWASKDLLWTVGNEGMFTQTDVTFAPQIHNETSPCTVDWFPNGEYAAFAEDRGIRRGSELEDPAVGFLNVRQERLSSGERATYSPNLSEDETDNDGFFTTSFKRRQSRAASSRSAKSRTSSPPYKDDQHPVLSLDKAVSERHESFRNNQIGFISETKGVAMETPVVQFLAENCSRASNETERKAQPEKILERLESAFKTNAEASEHVAMYRLGQTWRILSAVIVPELRNWADHNRHRRLSDAKVATQKVPSASSRHLGGKASVSNHNEKLTKMYAIEPNQSVKRPGHVANGLGEFRSHRLANGMESTSEMTTPLARPLPDSPLLDQESGYSYYGTEESVEQIPPLSPSMMTSHSTAAAASKALREDASRVSDTPPSSPEARRLGDSQFRTHRRNHTSDSMLSSSSWLLPPKSSPQAIQGRSPGRRADLGSPKPQQREEDRRAALRDYRVQARPLLTLQEPVAGQSSTGPLADFRHDSNESFPMFSASTDSSQRARSFGASFGSPDDKTKASITPERWLERNDSFEPSSPPSDESGGKGNLSRVFGAIRSDLQSEAAFIMDDAPSPRLGVDVGTSNSRIDAGGWSNSTDSCQTSRGRSSQGDPSLSSSPEEPFQFDEPEQRLQIARQQLQHHQHKISTAPLSPRNQPAHTPSQASEEFLNDCPDYIHADFRPIDIANYSPSVPVAWSALALIAHAIEFDLDSGQGCGQFSAHLLMHMHPFFFHQRYRTRQSNSDSVAKPHRTIAEKLMNPSYNERIVESVFLNHYQFLKKMDLFIPMAELRNLCVEYDLPHIYNPTGTSSDETTLNGINQYSLSITCANCHGPLQGGVSLCSRCRTMRDPCPICLSLRYDYRERFDMIERNGGDKSMWMLCQSCGHNAHLGCMEMWLVHEYSDGQCPSKGCTCDCGPGSVRQERIKRQMKEEEDGKLVKGGRSGSPRVKEEKRERVGESRAVERTRMVLRGKDRVQTPSGSDDESGSGMGSRRKSGSVGPTSGGSGLGRSQSQRKVVRVMTPGEEIG